MSAVYWSFLWISFYSLDSYIHPFSLCIAFNSVCAFYRFDKGLVCACACACAWQTIKNSNKTHIFSIGLNIYLSPFIIIYHFHEWSRSHILHFNVLHIHWSFFFFHCSSVSKEGIGLHYSAYMHSIEVIFHWSIGFCWNWAFMLFNWEENCILFFFFFIFCQSIVQFKMQENWINIVSLLWE